ncbi:MAG: hypothetical protein R3A52_18285 [Polyangiales bacterium]
MAKSTARAAGMSAVVALAAVVGCSEQGVPERVQRAVASGAQGALAAMPGAVARQAAPDAARVPAAVGTGEAMRFPDDAAHRDVAAVRGTAGWSLAWTDASRQAVYFGRADAEGRALGDGRGVELRRVADEEESVASPAVLSARDGAVVAWVDGENGRVLARRVGAQGEAAGPTRIVHEGLESPRSVRLSADGSGFGLAVGLWQGVYFARLDATAERVGDGVMVAEGEPVDSVESLRSEHGRWTLSWRAAPGAPVQERTISARELRGSHTRAALGVSSARRVGSRS